MCPFRKNRLTIAKIRIANQDSRRDRFKNIVVNDSPAAMKAPNFVCGHVCEDSETPGLRRLNYKTVIMSVVCSATADKSGGVKIGKTNDFKIGW